LVLDIDRGEVFDSEQVVAGSVHIWLVDCFSGLRSRRRGTGLDE
jgi:hypothetical protein